MWHPRKFRLERSITEVLLKSSAIRNCTTAASLLQYLHQACGPLAVCARTQSARSGDRSNCEPAETVAAAREREMTDEIRALIKLVAVVGLIILFIVDFLISPLFKPKGFIRRVVTSTIGIALVFVVLLL
jgi:hypothetical protein